MALLPHLTAECGLDRRWEVHQRLWRLAARRRRGFGDRHGHWGVIVGEFGCEQRTDYTIIGPTVILARICAVAKPGEVLVSQETYDLIKDSVEATPIHGMRFKGIDQDVTVYSVTRVLD